MKAKANTTKSSRPKHSSRASLLATILYTILIHTAVICYAFNPTSHHTFYHQANKTRRKEIGGRLFVFRDLALDDDEDLRAVVTVIQKADGLDNFLAEDDRLCAIK